jgi:hypothetical protein
MIEEKVGIKESKEAIDGAVELSKFVISRAKDGIGIDDASALVMKLLADEAFKAKLQSAVEGIQLVPAEFKDLDFSEGVELGVFAAGKAKEIIDELKK